MSRTRDFLLGTDERGGVRVPEQKADTPFSEGRPRHERIGWADGRTQTIRVKTVFMGYEIEGYLRRITEVVLTTAKLITCSVHSVPYPALQDQQKRRAHIVEHHRHPDSFCRMGHCCAALKEFNGCPDFHED